MGFYILVDKRGGARIVRTADAFPLNGWERARSWHQTWDEAAAELIAVQVAS